MLHTVGLTRKRPSDKEAPRLSCKGYVGANQGKSLRKSIQAQGEIWVEIWTEFLSSKTEWYFAII